MKKFIDNLKLRVQENPLETLFVTSLSVATLTRLMRANTERVNSKTWAKEVDRRRMAAIK